MKETPAEKSVSAIPRKQHGLKPKGETQRTVGEKEHTLQFHNLATISKHFFQSDNQSLDLKLEDPTEGLRDKTPTFSDCHLSKSH